MVLYINSIEKYQTQEALSLKLNSRRANSRRKQTLKSNSSENFENGQATVSIEVGEIEIEFRKQADLYEWLGARLNERKTELTNCLGQMKAYLTDLHGVDSRLSALETELVLTSLPLERNALEAVRDSGRRVGGELARLGADLETIRVKGRQIMLDESKSGASEVKRQLSSLNDRFTKLVNHNESVKSSVDKFAAALGAFEAQFANLEHSLRQKQEMIDVMAVDKHINTDLALIEVQLKQIELMRNDLKKSDMPLLNQLNQAGDILLTQGQEDSNYEQVKSELAKINTDFNLLSEQLNTVIEFKEKMHSMSSEFVAQQNAFKTFLAKVHAEIAQLAGQHPSSVTQADLNSLEHDQLPECGRKLDSCDSLLTQIVDINRGFRILHGYADLDLSAGLDHDLRQMRTDLETAECRLKELNVHVNQQRTIDQLHAALEHFIALKLEQLEADKSVSGELAKLDAQRQSHDTFIGDLIERGDDVKKLMEYFAESEEVESGAQLEVKWNQLCARSDARKEKLFVCYSMAEQFEDTFVQLKSFLASLTSRLEEISSSEGIESRIARLEQAFSDLDRSEAVDIARLKKIGAELKQACTTDTDYVDIRLDEACGSVNSLRNKITAFSESYKEHLEKERAFTASVNDVKSELKDLEERLAECASSDTSSAALLLLDPAETRRRDELRQKLDLCKQLIDNETSVLGDENKANTLQELKSLFDRLENLIEMKQKEQIARQNEEFENFKKGKYSSSSF